jgi:putative ABC transport system substrate-binding protein
VERFFCALILTLVVLTTHSSGKAQQAVQAPRIGFLGSASASALASRREAFQQGLRELGYQEGENIVIEYRYADGKFDRLPTLANELVKHKVEVIVTHGEAAIRALNGATKTIPIVVGVTGDLVASGHARSLARPGGNVTGLVDTSPDVTGKRLELLKEVLPKVSRIGVLWNGANRIKVLDFKETEVAARALGLKLQSLEVRRPEEFELKLSAAPTHHYSALLVLQDALTLANARKIVDFANTNRLPAMYGSSEFVDVGGLVSYAANFPDLFRRAATYVDKILKGANPAHLPIEQPTKFDLVINLKTAKQAGFTVPLTLLYRADRIIR